MKIAYCQSCKRDTGFKRALGWGTFFACVLTAGFWLLIVPFYPKRCVICGMAMVKSASSSSPASASFPSAGKKPWYRSVWGLVFLIIGFAILSNVVTRYTDNSPPEIETKSQSASSSGSKTKPNVQALTEGNKALSERERFATRLTEEIRNNGYDYIIMKADGKEHRELQIHADLEQEEKMADGQMTTLLGTLLKPEMVARLKKEGFKSGVLIDGKSRRYPFAISNEHNAKLKRVFKNISGGN